VAWTLIPVLILVGIAVPSFRLLFQELDIPKRPDDQGDASSGTGATLSDNGKFEFDFAAGPGQRSPGYSGSITRWWCR